MLKDEQDFLTKFSCLTKNFYGVPRANKSEIIPEAIQVHNSEYLILNTILILLHNVPGKLNGIPF